MGPRRSCAACGRPVRGGKAIEVSVWEGEGLVTEVCSEACRAAYEAGQVAAESPREADRPVGPERLPRVAAVVVLALAAAVEIVRAAAQGTFGDPLGLPQPWVTQAATAGVLLLTAAALVVRRPSASRLAFAVSAIIAAASFVAASRTGDPRPALIPVSLTVPIFLLLLGRPGRARLAFAFAAALLLPAYVGYRGSLRMMERTSSIERAERMSRPGPTVPGAPGSIDAELPEGWRSLVHDNGIVDWPHSELEVIHPRSGAAAFVVLNPDCQAEGLPDFQARSLDALAESGADPVVTGLTRLGGGTVELRVEIERNGRRLRTFGLFRVLPGEGSPPGCLWIQCLPAPQDTERYRQDCRRLAASIERVPEA